MSPHHLSRFEHRTEDEPVSRLGRIAKAMLEAGEQHPEAREDDRAVVMLDAPSESRGTLAHGGYDEDAEVFVNMLGQLDAIAQANGVTLNFVPMEKPSGEG